MKMKTEESMKSPQFFSTLLHTTPSMYYNQVTAGIVCLIALLSCYLQFFQMQYANAQEYLAATSFCLTLSAAAILAWRSGNPTVVLGLVGVVCIGAVGMILWEQSRVNAIPYTEEDAPEDDSTKPPIVISS